MNRCRRGRRRAAMTFSKVRLPGSMVVSFSCAGIISPRALEAADFDVRVRTKFALYDLGAMRLVARVERLSTMREAIERRNREIEVPLLDHLRHLPVEERDQQRSDVRADRPSASVNTDDLSSAARSYAKFSLPGSRRLPVGNRWSAQSCSSARRRQDLARKRQARAGSRGAACCRS